MAKKTPIEFFDLRTQTKFFSSDYQIKVTAKGMLMAKATAPSGTITVKMLRKA